MLYPLYWAKPIVKQALEKHARVSDDFLTLTGLSSTQLATLLAEGRPEWAILRDMLKVMDNWRARSKYLTSVELFRQLILMYRVKMPEKMRLYLDNRVKCTRIEEQGKGRSPFADTSADGLQPLRGSDGEIQA